MSSVSDSPPAPGLGDMHTGQEPVHPDDASVAEFRETVRTYVAIHDELQNSSKQLRDLRKKKVELGEAIIAYMKANGIDELQMADGKLVRKQSKKTEGVKKEHILCELKKMLDAEAAESCITNILSQRTVEMKDALRRTKAKNT